MIDKLNPKTIRTMAKAMLDLADALDDGKVRMVPPGKPYAEHVFVKPLNFDRILADEEIPIETTGMTNCKHDLKYYTFSLVGAYCLISKEFFIDAERTRVLAESSHYLTAK